MLIESYNVAAVGKGVPRVASIVKNPVSDRIVARLNAGTDLLANL